MTPLTPGRIAAIHGRVTEARRWITADTCNADGFLPLSVRELFDHDVENLLAEVERLRVHSTTLNSVAWKIASAIGDVPNGADQITGNAEDLADRLIAEGERLRGDVEYTARTIEFLHARLAARLVEVERLNAIRDAAQTWRHGGGDPGYDAAGALIAAVDEFEAMGADLRESAGEQS